MKINGSLIFDASSASEIHNLRLEKFGAVPAAPVAGDSGRLIYVTGTGIIYVAVATLWVPLATGGDASALLAEVDRIETSLGLNSDGSFNASLFTGNLTSKTSYVELVHTLQDLIATNATAIAAETTRATGVEGTLTTNLAAEVTRATTAEGTLTSNLATETTNRTSADTTHTNAISAEVTRATSAEGTLTTNLAAEVTRAGNAEVGIQGSLTSEISRATAAEAAARALTATEATTARAAEGTLTTNLAAEATTARAAEGTLTTNLATEVTRATAAEGVIATNLASEISRATAAESAITSDFNARIQGLAWKNPVRVATVGNVDLASAAAGYDGVTLVANDRVLVHAQTAASENGIYVFHGAGSTLTRAVDMDTAAEFFSATVYVREGTTQADLGFTQTAEIVTIGTDLVGFVQFNGAGSVTAGNGLTQNGNALNVVSADSSITITADAIQVSGALQTAVSNNTTAIGAESTARAAGDATNATAITQEATDRATAISAETTARISYVNAETTRATAAEGILTNNLSTEASRATAAEGVIAGNLATETANRISADNTNATAIGTETTRATAAEAAARALTAAETTRAEGAETALSTRVTTAEGKLNKLYFMYDGSTAGTVHTVTHNLGQQFCNVTVIDASNEMVIPQSVTFTGVNSLTVAFNSSIACKVVVMGLA